MFRIVLMTLAALLLTGLARASMLTTAAESFAGHVSTDGYFDYTGLVHLHTEYSGDASGTYAAVARDAEVVGVRFLIATEHENLDALRDGREGWYGSTLMLSGAESTRPEGSLLGLDIDAYPVTREDATASFLDSVTAQGGMVILAHADSPRWAWQGPLDDRVAGMEMLDLADLFHTASVGEKLTAVALLPVNRTAAYLELGRSAGSPFDIWDGVGKKRKFVGLYAPDFHQCLEIINDRCFAFPRARDIMGLVRNHILTRTPFTGDAAVDRQTVYAAIAAGHLYVSLDVLADATGFMFSAVQDGRKVVMGDELDARAGARFTVTLPPTARTVKPTVHLIKDGIQIAVLESRDGTVRFSDRGPGVYRIEVRTDIPTFFGRDRNAVWIYSNPIYLRQRG
ncbi:MAG: hypothetical protein ACI9YM_001804 [Brevundimonas sp.]|jgi:hypothetical protein|uniref:hypothetical protein n=1 Tax=Brevundimonas sp. TaxID=1871086 RepID=UPI0039E3EEF7